MYSVPSIIEAVNDILATLQDRFLLLAQQEQRILTLVGIIITMYSWDRFVSMNADNIYDSADYSIVLLPSIGASWLILSLPISRTKDHLLENVAKSSRLTLKF